MTPRYEGPNGKRSISLRFVLIWPNDGLWRKSISPSVILGRLLNWIISVLNTIKMLQNARIYHKCVTLCLSSNACMKRPRVDKMVSLLFWWNTRLHWDLHNLPKARQIAILLDGVFNRRFEFCIYMYTYIIYIYIYNIMYIYIYTVRLLTHVLCKSTQFFFHSFIATMLYSPQTSVNSVMKDWANKYHVWSTPTRSPSRSNSR